MPSAFDLIHRNTHRASVNPADVSTIVSIFPKPLHEKKWTLQPGVFKIPAGSYENPSLVVIGPSSWWRDLGPEEPLLEIPVPSHQVAEAVVVDYCNGLIECDMASMMPGLFFIPSRVTLAELKKEHLPLLNHARDVQNAWFSRLVELADVMWSNTNANPRAIPGDAKLAATSLGVDREWMLNQIQAKLVRCFACGNLRNPAYPICSHCKVIDQAHPDAGKIKFAV